MKNWYSYDLVQSYLKNIEIIKKVLYSAGKIV